MTLEPAYADGPVTIYLADCIQAMRQLPDASVDSVVTDPPYGLEFMGREWDGADGFRRSLNAADVGRENTFGRMSAKAPEYRAGKVFQDWCEAWATECLRVLKPGGHLLAFGGTRTFHRLAAGIEDAGFEIRDSIAWLYGSGFPKSLDVSKAIDKMAGAEREIVGRYTPPNGTAWNLTNDMARSDVGAIGHSSRADSLNVTAPATLEAQKWAGWGTALKPAFEPVVVARKPLSGTVAANVLEYGTGALNIDASRIGSEPVAAHRGTANPRTAMGDGWSEGYQPGDAGATPLNTAGRWPSNVILDPDTAIILDTQSGTTRDGVAVKRNLSGGSRTNIGATGIQSTPKPDEGFGGEGGASRFFKVVDPDPPFLYTAKAPSAERPVHQRKVLRLRKDLTPEQADHVTAQLRAAGVQVD